MGEMWHEFNKYRFNQGGGNLLKKTNRLAFGWVDEWSEASVDSVTLLRTCNLLPANWEFIGKKSLAHLVNGKVKLQSLIGNV